MVSHAFSSKLIREIRETLLEEGSDLLYTVGYKADVHGGLATHWGALIPCVSIVHGWLFRKHIKERMYHRLNLMALNRCSGVVVLSTWYQAYLSRNIPRQSIHLIPSGLAESTPHQQSDHHTEGVTVGWLGRLSEEKDPSLFLNAMRILIKDRNRPISGIIAGEGPLMRAVELEAEMLGLKEEINIPGHMNRETFYARVDVLVNSSVIENLPYTILEAMARSIPVVACGVGGIPDLIVDGETGFLSPSRTPEELADRLDELVGKEELRQAFGSAGKQRAETHYGFQQSIQRHVQLCRSLVGKTVAR